MKTIFKLFFLCLVIISCKKVEKPEVINNNELVIAFGSCNNQYAENLLWKEVFKHQPTMWIWGGDIVYSDSENKEKLQKDYNLLLAQEDYKTLLNTTRVVATWDDHDYGLNDGGEEFHFKKESQQLFLDFMNVPKNDPRREQEGVYHIETINTKDGTVKILMLDTRYFRSSLTKSRDTTKRYEPNPYGKGTILGEQQWQWLESELKNSKADFNIIMSSIQVLSGEHGFETWANFPHEVDKLLGLIEQSKANGVLILSGDRHISEFSKTIIKGFHYPLIDFTSSGLTHSFSGFNGEANKFRVGNVVSDLSFGLLKVNFKTNTIKMQMRGKGNSLQQELIQQY